MPQRCQIEDRGWARALLGFGAFPLRTISYDALKVPIASVSVLAGPISRRELSAQAQTGVQMPHHFHTVVTIDHAEATVFETAGTDVTEHQIKATDRQGNIHH